MEETGAKPQKDSLLSELSSTPGVTTASSTEAVLSPTKKPQKNQTLVFQADEDHEKPTEK